MTGKKTRKKNGGADSIRQKINELYKFIQNLKKKSTPPNFPAPTLNSTKSKKEKFINTLSSWDETIKPVQPYYLQYTKKNRKKIQKEMGKNLSKFE